MLGACLGLPSLRGIYAIGMGEAEQDEPTTSLADSQKAISSVEEIELRGT